MSKEKEVKEEKGYLVTPLDKHGKKLIGSRIVETEDLAVTKGRELLTKGNGMMGILPDEIIITPCIRLTSK